LWLRKKPGFAEITMSIAVLNQVYDETRRLAIAGSVVARGDFRLKKLVPPLEQAGAKAPVFAKAAQAVTALVEANEQASAQSLLDLCTLVTAVLYTQGETGQAGDLKPIETTDLGAQATQASARILKPLLEALTTTGSGRLEIIRDAHQRSAFRDLRLVKPALAALDDAYPEIGDFVAEHVLPLYGQAILPELKTRLDIKGKGGHVRRLSLMHQLDPSGTRELVKDALENGSKEIKVAAIGCLGGDAEDLAFLLEQSQAKAKDVRGAALISLAKLDAPAAIEALQQALSGGDLELAIHPVMECRHPKLLKFVLDEAQREFDAVCTLKDKKAIAKSADRLESLLHCLTRRDDKATEAFLLKCFARRDELQAVKAEDVGATLTHRIALLMAAATKKTQDALVAAHATLENAVFQQSFFAACRTLTPKQVFDTFSPYLAEQPDAKKKSKDRTTLKPYFIANVIQGEVNWRYGYDSSEQAPIEWDPRWLDLVVKLKLSELVHTLARPGHAAANKLLSELFTAAFPKSKSLHDCDDVLRTMVRVQHPDAAKSLMAILSKHAGAKSKYNWGAYWIARMIPDLPKSAAPELEALLPTLHEKAVDELIEAVQMLKQKS
jgi:hypothetical protein